jgi:hypothetical protein
MFGFWNRSFDSSRETTMRTLRIKWIAMFCLLVTVSMVFSTLAQAGLKEP